MFILRFKPDTKITQYIPSERKHVECDVGGRFVRYKTDRNGDHSTSRIGKAAVFYSEHKARMAYYADRCEIVQVDINTKETADVCA